MDRGNILCCMTLIAVISYASAACSIKLPDGITTQTTTWDYCKNLGEADFFWKYDTTTLTCAVVTRKGSGYVGVGFKAEDHKEKGMWGADIYVGFIDSTGKKVFMDMISKKPPGTAEGKLGGAPVKDTTQNGKLLTIAHVAGKHSVLEFSRPLKAADAEDVTIDPKKELEILWATGSSTGDKLSYHSSSGNYRDDKDVCVADPVEDSKICKSGAEGIFNLVSVSFAITISLMFSLM